MVSRNTQPGARVSQTLSHPGRTASSQTLRGKPAPGEGILAKGQSPTLRCLPMDRGSHFQDVYPGPTPVPGLAGRGAGGRTGRDLSNVPSMPHLSRGRNGPRSLLFPGPVQAPRTRTSPWWSGRVLGSACPPIVSKWEIGNNFPPGSNGDPRSCLSPWYLFFLLKPGLTTSKVEFVLWAGKLRLNVQG